MRSLLMGVLILSTVATASWAGALRPVNMDQARKVARHAAAVLDRGSDEAIGHRTYNCRRISRYRVDCTLQLAMNDGSDCYGVIKVSRPEWRYRWDSQVNGCL